jgi:hypothetical protein
MANEPEKFREPRQFNVAAIKERANQLLGQHRHSPRRLKAGLASLIYHLDCHVKKHGSNVELSLLKKYLEARLLKVKI